jgi:hypothetical protein
MHWFGEQKELTINIRLVHRKWNAIAVSTPEVAEGAALELREELWRTITANRFCTVMKLDLVTI